MDSLPAEPQGKPKNTGAVSLSLLQGWEGLLEKGEIYPLQYSGLENSSPWGCEESDRTLKMVLTQKKSLKKTKQMNNNKKTVVVTLRESTDSRDKSENPSLQSNAVNTWWRSMLGHSWQSREPEGGFSERCSNRISRGR